MTYVITEVNGADAKNIHAVINDLESHIQVKDKKLEQIQYKEQECPNLPVLPPSFFGLPTWLKHNWKQYFGVAGTHTLFRGTDCCECCGNCNLIDRNAILLWVGLAFLDEAYKRRITRIKPIIRDRLIAEINLEEAIVYNKPMVLFESGFILRGSERFVLECYLEGSLPRRRDGTHGIYQNVVMLGKAFKIK